MVKMKNHNMYFIISVLSLVFVTPFAVFKSWIALIAVIVSAVFWGIWYILEVQKQEEDGEEK